MKPVDQTVVDKGRGNCMQAAIASLFELELSQVPNLILYDNCTWFKVLYFFYLSMGYDYQGLEMEEIRYEDSIEGYFDATVPSRTFSEGTHAVIMDMNGVVVHDPNPNKAWLGEKIFGQEGVWWYTFAKIDNAAYQDDPQGVKSERRKRSNKNSRNS